jgi:hypothetical protein
MFPSYVICTVFVGNGALFAALVLEDELEPPPHPAKPIPATQTIVGTLPKATTRRLTRASVYRPVHVSEFPPEGARSRPHSR